MTGALLLRRAPEILRSVTRSREGSNAEDRNQVEAWLPVPYAAAPIGCSRDGQ